MELHLIIRFQNNDLYMINASHMVSSRGVKFYLANWEGIALFNYRRKFVRNTCGSDTITHGQRDKESAKYRIVSAKRDLTHVFFKISNCLYSRSLNCPVYIASYALKIGVSVMEL